MKPNKKLSIIFSFILLAGMLLFGSAVSAKDGSTQVKGIQPLQNALDQLVKEEVLTKEKAEEVRAYFGKKCEGWKKRHEEMKKLSPEERKVKIEKWRSEKRDHNGGDFTNQLVQDKIVTQEQADALTAKLRENLWQQKKEHIVTGLNGLVDKGILNQQQVDKVLKQLDQTRTERKELFERIRDMSPEERHRFFKENKAKLTSPLEQLQKAGVINEEQAKAIREILPHCKVQIRAHNRIRS